MDRHGDKTVGRGQGLMINLEMWNQRVLVPPPTCSFKVTLTQELKGEILYVQGQLGNGKSDIASHLRVLSSEQYVQDRMIYKLNSQFRSEKSLKHMKQARVCLNRLKELDLQRQLEDLIATFTVNLQKEECVYLPSKQTLQYHLVRLMSTAALLSRTCQLLKQTYFFAKQLMEIGNMLSQNLMLIAISARLWVTCKSLKSCVCVWYQVLYPVLESLQETPVPWLQSYSDGEETLPVNLTTWLQFQFDVDSSKDDDSMMRQAAELTFSDNESGEELVSNRTDKLSLGMMTEDIGEPVQRKTREEIDDKIETTDQQSVTTDNPLSVNRLPEDQNRQSEDQGKFHVKPIEDVKQSLNKRKVKKHLEKKLKTLIKIVKTLKMIKRENSVQIGLYEFETTAEFRLTAKQMLGSCKQFMKENPRESQIKKKKFENSMAIPFQKMLVDKLLELTWQYKQNLPVAETVDCSLNNTTSMQHKLSNEDSDLTKLCKENDMDGKFDSDTCITKTDKFHENIQSIDFKNISCVDPIDAGSKIKRKRNRSRNNRSKKKKEKTIKENNDLEKVGSVPVDDRVETKKSQHQALESSHQEDFEQRTKSGKKKKSKNKCVSIGENASGPDSVLKQKRKQAAETEVPQKKRKIKCDKIQEKNHKKKRGNKESKLHMPKQKRNIIK